MKIQRQKHDIVMSNLVRCATNYSCENCGKYYPPDLRRGIHCSHFWGRGIKQLRYSELNCSALCYGCHMKLTSDPWAHMQFMQKRVGTEVLEQMAKLAYCGYKWGKKDQDACLIHLIEQWRIMSQKRREGETGIIEYTGWTPWWRT